MAEITPLHAAYDELSKAHRIAAYKRLKARKNKLYGMSHRWKQLSVGIHARLHLYREYEAAKAARKRARPAAVTNTTHESAAPGPTSDAMQTPVDQEEPGHHFAHKPLQPADCERGRAPKLYKHKRKRLLALTAASRRKCKTLTPRQLDNLKEKLTSLAGYTYKKKRFPSYGGHSFSICFGKLWCQCCRLFLKPSDMSQHIHGSTKVFQPGRITKRNVELAKWLAHKCQQQDIVEILNSWAASAQREGRHCPLTLASCVSKS